MSFDFNTVIKNYKFNSILRKCPGFTEKFSVIDSAEKEANENNQYSLALVLSLVIHYFTLFIKEKFWIKQFLS